VERFLTFYKRVRLWSVRNKNMKKGARKRVVVTGIGAVCNLGTTIPEIWDNILKGEVAFRNMDTDDHPDFAKLKYTVGAPIPRDFDLEAMYKKYPNARHRSGAMAMAAAE
jgi:3-oxoacyl-[acyl-carrier-protein] synthase II